ncbi:MAG TPA: ASCH domain-containing protein [Candidatus Saccharimonadales bacterium]|nr:ASCH domain-containing protein [Candidatus Saccharimonadales bacterium]
MTHYSVVSAGVFDQIKKGERIIEPRLNDEAHRRIRPGDLIIVTNRATEEEVVTKVVGVLRYPSFVELLQAYPPARFGASDERYILAEMRRYYTNDQEIAHGVLGIKLHVLKGASKNGD